MNCCDYAALVNSSPWPSETFFLATRQNWEELENHHFFLADQARKRDRTKMVRTILEERQHTSTKKVNNQ